MCHECAMGVPWAGRGRAVGNIKSPRLSRLCPRRNYQILPELSFGVGQGLDKLWILNQLDEMLLLYKVCPHLKLVQILSKLKILITFKNLVGHSVDKPLIFMSNPC